MNRSPWISGCALLSLMATPLLAETNEADDRVNQFRWAATDDPLSQVAATVPSAAEKSLLGVPADRPTNAVMPPGKRCRCVGESDSESVATIEKVLRSALASAGLNFTDAPLEKVAGSIRDTYQIPVQLDLPALEEIGVDAGEPVTTNLHGVSLRSALRLMLEPLGLTYIIRNEVLLITAPEVAEAELTTCVYDVRDLVQRTRGSVDFDPLIDTIISCVASETWAENGGGESDIRPLQPGFLVVSQAASVHEEIEGLLNTIREMNGGPVAAYGGPNASLDELVTEWNLRQ
jgi:hypothetical protein